MLAVLTLSLDCELLGVSFLSTQCPAQALLHWTLIKSQKREQTRIRKDLKSASGINSLSSHPASFLPLLAALTRH